MKSYRETPAKKLPPDAAPKPSKIPQQQADQSRFLPLFGPDGRYDEKKFSDKSDSRSRSLQQQSALAVEIIKAKWKQYVGSAQILWGRLTEDEILQSEGNAKKLSGLLQRRYALSRYDADSQVKRFLDKTTPE